MSETGDHRRRRIEAHAFDEEVAAFFNGAIRIVEWWDRKTRCERYSLIVGNDVETIGAYSPREAVTLARENRRFVSARDSGEAV